MTASTPDFPLPPRPTAPTPIHRASVPAARPGGQLQRLLALLLALLQTLLLTAGLSLGPSAALAALNDDRYDGNIFALYAGNGSLVPPRSSLAQARSDGRVAVLIYYLDDCSACKRFSPVVSELQRRWGNAIELIPLVTDPLQNRTTEGPTDPATYWKGTIPQVVVIDAEGRVVFDASGAVPIGGIDAAISRATGIPLSGDAGTGTTMSFNELNSEVVSSQP